MSVQNSQEGGIALPCPDTVDVHSFLLGTRHQKHHPVDILLPIRDYVDGLSEMTATFTLTDALEGTEYTHQSVPDEMLYLLGSWQSSLAGTRTTHWVNPDHIHRIRHSDVVTHCECGALMARQKEVYHDCVHDADNQHTDACTKQDRLMARARLCEARADAMRQGLRAGHSGRSMADRLGLEDSIGETASDLGVDVAALKAEYTRKRTNTILHLLPEFCPREVGKVYGISASRVREIVACDTEYDISDFTSLRRGDDA